MATEHKSMSFFDLAKEIEKGHSTFEVLQFLEIIDRTQYDYNAGLLRPDDDNILTHIQNKLNEWLGTIPAGPYVVSITLLEGDKFQVDYITHDQE